MAVKAVYDYRPRIHFTTQKAGSTTPMDWCTVTASIIFYQHYPKDKNGAIGGTP